MWQEAGVEAALSKHEPWRTSSAELRHLHCSPVICNLPDLSSRSAEKWEEKKEATVTVAQLTF
jgi:hypothetical protein